MAYVDDVDVLHDAQRRLEQWAQVSPSDRERPHVQIRCWNGTEWADLALDQALGALSADSGADMAARLPAGQGRPAAERWEVRVRVAGQSTRHVQLPSRDAVRVYLRSLQGSPLTL